MTGAQLREILGRLHQKYAAMEVQKAAAGANGECAVRSCSSCSGADTPPRRESPRDSVKEEPQIFAPPSRLDLGQQLRLSCQRAVRHGEMREQVCYEKTGGSKEHAFDDHLYLAEPTRRSCLTRNNACLDLGALSRRASPFQFEETQK